MKELNFLQVTIMRWGVYFLAFSIAQRITALVWPETRPNAWWATYLVSLFLAIVIPLASVKHRKRKIFIQNMGDK